MTGLWKTLLMILSVGGFMSCGPTGAIDNSSTKYKPRADDPSPRGGQGSDGTGATFSLSECGFDITNPAAGTAKQFNGAAQSVEVETSLLPILFSKKVAVPITSILAVESSLERVLVTAKALAASHQDKAEVKSILSGTNRVGEAMLLDLPSREAIGTTFPAWAGQFCVMQPATKITRGNEKKVITSFSQPIPFGIAEAKKEVTTKVTTDGGEKLLKEKVEVIVRSRGRTDMTVGSFTLADAMERANRILAAEGVEGEGVVQVKIRRYNNVRIVIGDMEKRMGDVFTTKVTSRVAKESDVFAKLGAEKVWAERNSSSIFSTYAWDQWSLVDRYHNGIAKQYKALVQYKRDIANVFKFCGEEAADTNTASEECLERANNVAKRPRPKLNLPKPYPHQMDFWMPPEVIAAADNKDWKSGKGQVTQLAAKQACSRTTGWSVPDRENWKRIVDASYFYLQWRRDQNPAYRAESDTQLLSYPCGRFQNAFFWTAEQDKVLEIAPGCDSQALTTSFVPDQHKFMRWVFWTQERCRFACVKFNERE